MCLVQILNGVYVCCAKRHQERERHVRVWSSQGAAVLLHRFSLVFIGFRKCFWQRIQMFLTKTREHFSPLLCPRSSFAHLPRQIGTLIRLESSDYWHGKQIIFDIVWRFSSGEVGWWQWWWNLWSKVWQVWWILWWPDWVKAPTSSIGRGKMIVEFFSAEIEFNVCRYLVSINIRKKIQLDS